MKPRRKPRKARKVKCSATTRKGLPCPNNADPGSTLCHVHRPGDFQRQQTAEKWIAAAVRQRDPPPGRCIGTTKSGAPCTNLPMPGSLLCGWHDPAQVRCSFVNPTSKHRCGNLPADDGPLCDFHRRSTV